MIKRNMKTPAFILAIFLSGVICAQSPKHLMAGDTMPTFSLPDQDGKIFNSSDVKGKSLLVIFFYAKDNAQISSKQVIAFKERFKEFEEEGAMVIGINAGTIESHKEFHQKNGLPYPLLSDKDSKVINQFGIKSTLGAVNRETYVVDYSGKIVFFLDAYMDGAKHAEEALKYLKSQD